jgi:hypothetical protein
MSGNISAVRPVTFTPDGGITFAYSVGRNIKELLARHGDGRGVILLMVDTTIIVPGVMEANQIEMAYIPGDEIFEDSPFDEEDQGHIRDCMTACTPSEYVLIVVLYQHGLNDEAAQEEVHICVASRDFEEGRITVYDPRNN